MASLLTSSTDVTQDTLFYQLSDTEIVELSVLRLRFNLKSVFIKLSLSCVWYNLTLTGCKLQLVTTRDSLSFQRKCVYSIKLV